MHHFIQFYDFRDGRYIERCGSDSVYLLDNRWSRAHMESEAVRVCAQQKFAGWRLARSVRLLDNPFFLTAAVRAAC